MCSVFDSLPVVLPTWDEVARGWPRTIGHRFQSNLRATDVVVCNFCLIISQTRCKVLIRLNSAWGFFVALLTFSFQNMSWNTWIPMGTAAGTITVLIVWCITNTWGPEEREEGLEWPQLGNVTQLDSSTQA